MATGPSGHWLDGSSASGEGLPGAGERQKTMTVELEKVPFSKGQPLIVDFPIKHGDFPLLC